MLYTSVIRRIIFFITLLLSLYAQNIFAEENNQNLASNFNANYTMAPRKIFQNINSVSALKKAISLSLAKSKPVFIMYSATWCGYCKAADRDVFSNAQVQKALKGTTTLRVDSSDGTPEQVEMMNLYNIRGFPTIIGFDSNGNYATLNQEVSVKSVLDFIAQLKQLNQPSVTNSPSKQGTTNIKWQ
jgi:thiol:disulfide interchange protein